MKTEDRAGLATSWITCGDGPHPALFLHSALASSNSLLPLMERLSGILEMVAPDLPGHGKSADWDGQGDFLLRSAEMAATFCQSQRDVVAHSLGAVVALAMMAKGAAQVRRAVLIEPPLFFAAEGTEAYEDHQEAYAGVIGALEDGDPDTATARFTDIWGAGQPWSAIPPAHRRAMAERMHLVRATEQGLQQDSAGLGDPGVLEAIDVPILFVRCGQSHPVTADIHRYLMSRLPKAEEVVLQGAGHMAPITHPDAVKEAIHDHIRRRRE